MFKWLVIGGVLASALALLASNGLIHQSASGKTPSGCPASPRVAGQDIENVGVDVSRSTADLELRREYAEAVSRAAADAANRGAYFRLSVFGSSIGDGRTICEASTRTDGAAPLFATAQQTAIREELDKAAQHAGTAQAAVVGSDPYGALVAAVEHTQALRNVEHVFARVVILTDGGQADDRIRLQRALKSASDAAIARRIVGNQPPPDARGIDIEIRGVGRPGVGRPLSTRRLLRLVHVWEAICAVTQAKSCQVTPELD